MADLQDDLDPTAEAGVVEPLPDPAGLLPDPAGLLPEIPEPLPVPHLEGAPASAPESRARALLDAHPVADGYSGLPWTLRELPWHDFETGDSGLESDIPRLRAGGVGAQLWSVHVPEVLSGDRAVAETLEQIDFVQRLVRAHPEGLRLARDASEAADARNCGRVATLIGPARAAALGDSLGTLRALRTLGLCALTLSGTSWAGPGGLTAFGEEVVREMNRLGVLADLSGASEATARRALAVSKAPVLFTRSGARAVREHPVNLPDDLLAAVGGAKGLCLVPLAVEQTGGSVGDVADHLDHVRRVAGPQCVGLSGTYDTPHPHPEGLADTAGYPRLIAELLERGWPEADIALLTWGNMQRALREADFTARATRLRRAASTARREQLDG
ncbi:membrane dipeptidase [Streptomyces alfalfae]|uniref:Dipeptidase n=1 Tax=Streptomyces alfalfae TaxID=1642299 RepID=A0A1P8TK46_9ACTN|nr:dipeptidase [Streptomyces alfalfae]AYA18341.1 membrane dipeptidase [Streptomyces fradiae]APY87965.1 peptidase M19 [Streptomyces alfalfae]QQC89638.1 dipeptidase [Streptomyces alfalfae]QUI32078.1 dipeptidase [Streptomyces alfalfae]RXX45323.1 membrane dipeptidase [Streptomyces alfalfae]